MMVNFSVKHKGHYIICRFFLGSLARQRHICRPGKLLYSSLEGGRSSWACSCSLWWARLTCLKGSCCGI